MSSQAQPLPAYASPFPARLRAVEPWKATAILALVALGFLVLLPLLIMLIASLRPAGVLPLESGPLTFDAFRRAFTGPDMLPVLANSVIYSGSGVLLALPLALGIALLTERSDLPLRDGVYAMMFVPLGIPVFATALGWILLLGPAAGVINQYLRLFTGNPANNGPINIFSLGGLIFVHVLGLVPSMWLFLISVLRNMDPTLEEAAAIAGASRGRVFSAITLPLLRPGVAAVLVYFMLIGLESLDLPLAIAPTAGLDVLSTKIYFTLRPSTNTGIDYGVPAAFGVLLLGVAIAGIALYLRLVGHASHYAVVSGRGYRPRGVALGAWKYPALALVGLYLFLKVLLPVAILVYTSLLNFYQPPVPKLMASLKWTANNYAALLDYRFFGRFFVNSVVVAVAAATITMLLVTVAAWLIVRYPTPLTRLLNTVAFMPLAIPGVISTLAFFLLFVGTPIFGTLLLMTFAFTARFIAFGTRLMHAAQLQINRELEEAAMVGGAGTLQMFVRINLRLLVPAFLNGWLWVLVHAAKDFSVALLLGSANTLLVGNVIYSAFTSGRFPQASAMMVLLFAFNFAAVLAGRRFAKAPATSTARA